MIMRTGLLAASAAGLLMLAGCKTGGMKVASAGTSVAGAASLPDNFAVRLHDRAGLPINA
jgi:hypothetical protein